MTINRDDTKCFWLFLARICFAVQSTDWGETTSEFNKFAGFSDWIAFTDMKDAFLNICCRWTLVLFCSWNMFNAESINENLRFWVQRKTTFAWKSKTLQTKILQFYLYSCFCLPIKPLPNQNWHQKRFFLQFSLQWK